MDDNDRKLLADNGFSPETFERLVHRLRLDPDAFESAVRERPVAPGRADFTVLPAPSTTQHQALAQAGTRAIMAGQVGAVVLAGGMATRFGGVVKADIPVCNGRSFLDLKLAAISRQAEIVGRTIPVFVMTSIATHARVVEALGRISPSALQVEVFRQSSGLRLTTSGEIFHDRHGYPSLHATGHGDLIFGLRASGMLARFQEMGGRLLAVSNVDNLPATLDPAIVGAHLESGRDVTVEVVHKHDGDHGGVPAWLDGRLQILEDFRLPAAFDRACIPVFNTNTFILSSSAVDRDFNFDWFTVRKQVEGTEVIQFERLLGQITAFLPTMYLHVPLGGPGGRFLPVKDPEELQRRLPEIVATLEAQGILRTSPPSPCDTGPRKRQ